MRSELFTIESGSPGLTADPPRFQGKDLPVGTPVKIYGAPGVKQPSAVPFRITTSIPPGYTSAYGTDCPGGPTHVNEIFPATFTCTIFLNYNGSETPPTPAIPTSANTPESTSHVPSQIECVPGYHWDSSEKQCVLTKQMGTSK
jgi:hypothetical protein